MAGGGLDLLRQAAVHDLSAGVDDEAHQRMDDRVRVGTDQDVPPAVQPRAPPAVQRLQSIGVVPLGEVHERGQDEAAARSPRGVAAVAVPHQVLAGHHVGDLAAPPGVAPGEEVPGRVGVGLLVFRLEGVHVVHRHPEQLLEEREAVEAGLGRVQLVDVLPHLLHRRVEIGGLGHAGGLRLGSRLDRVGVQGDEGLHAAVDGARGGGRDQQRQRCCAEPPACPRRTR